MLNWFATALFVVSFFATPASAADQQRIPTARWVVDFADHQCVASRQYGSADNPLILILKPSPLGGVMQITIVQNATGSRATVEIPATIQIDEQPSIKTSILAYTAFQSRSRLFTLNLPLPTFVPMHQATSVSVVAQGLRERLALSQMPELLKAMDRCVADLKRYWNLDAAGEKKIKSHAKANFHSLFSSDDYPEDAAFHGETGNVNFAVLVDETGKVADCTVTATSNVAVLDAQVCALVTSRATFKPAVGADGNPLKDGYAAAVNWRMSN